MPKIKPLSPEEARRTLAHRFAKRADRLRQLNTRFGIRPYRVTLVWSQWTGSERGEGTEKIIAEMELLPTPLVQSLESISMRLLAAGTLPEGTLRVGEVSAYYTQDQLTGNFIPTASFLERNNPPSQDTSREISATPHPEQIEQPIDFWYEVTEDGRGDSPAPRQRFRLSSMPSRNPENLEWILILERVSEDRSRDGESQIG